MIVEKPELLKQWLTGYLAPLCDADPEALAKYCLALVRKDRVLTELRASMVEQLDVFLQSNTKSFVDKFLQVTTTRSYIPKGTAPTSSSGNSYTTESLSSSTNTTGDSGPPPLPPMPATKQACGNSPDSTTPPNAVPLPATPSTASSCIVMHPTPPPLPPSSSIVPPPPPPPESAPPPPIPASVIVRKEEVTSSQRSRKSDSDRDRDERRGRRRSPSRGRSRSKSRSRSGSRDRLRRSRSRGRSGRSRYDDRRRRSPPSKRYRRSRTRSRTRSPRRSSRSPRRSRSRERRSRSRNRSRSLSPGNRRTRGRSPRSPSPLRKSKSITKDEKRDSPLHGSPSSDARIEPRTESNTVIQSVVAKHPDFQTTVSAKKQRCRDYDEKGYCMRGDMCPYDHGSDPVVLEGIGGVMDFPPPPVPGAGLGSTGYSPASDAAQGVANPRQPPMRHMQYGEYTPRDPSLWGGQPSSSGGPYYSGGQGRGAGAVGLRFNAPPPPLPGGSARELISVPVNNGSLIETSVRPSLAKRLGPAVPSHGNIPSSVSARPEIDNCTLELRKIPAGLNTISHLNDHFAKFGTIVNIQVHYENDPESALVTFTSHSEANAAYRSTEAVLNNRFIRLYWHNAQSKDRSTSYSTFVSRPPHDKMSIRHPNKTLNNIVETEDKTEKVILSGGSLVKTVYNTHALHSAVGANVSTVSPTAKSVASSAHVTSVSSALATSQNTTPPMSAAETKKLEIDAILKQRELMAAEVAAKQKVEKQKAEALKLKSEVEQRKKQLLDKQVQQMKVLVSKLDNNKSTMSVAEKKLLMETIKSLQGAIETTRAQLVSSDLPKTKTQVDREVLDTELELYSVQAEGGDITRLRNRLNQLKAQQKAVGFPARTTRANPYSLGRGIYSTTHGRGMSLVRGVTRGRGRGRGTRGFGYSFSTVDRRTTKIHASGFEREDKEEVLAHFSGLGSVTNYVWDDQTPAVTIQYSARREAEKAMVEGRTLGDRLLTLTWTFEASLPPRAQTTATGVIGNKHVSPLTFRSVTPHSTTPLLSPEDTLEEITEEIVEVEAEEGETQNIFEEEEEEVEEDEEEVRSWRR